LVYLIGARAYNRRVGLLGAAFAAFSVLPIQLSHYFKEDTFMVFFSTFALYLAVLIATGGSKGRNPQVREGVDAALGAPEGATGPLDEVGAGESAPQSPDHFRSQLLIFIFFGLAVGMAMASKVNSAPVAFVLPLAVLIRISRLPSAARSRALLESILYLMISGAAAFITFRLLQPYAFSGPGILGLIPNPEWLGDLRELQGITRPEAQFGFPPAVQWADRPVWFALENIIRWGLGIPLGILAWVGFLWVGWRILRGEWRTHILLWSFTGLYFLWQSSVFNPSMRYQLPIYPTLALYAAWAVVTVWDTRISQTSRFWLVRNWPKALAGAVGGVVLVGTVIWALAFTSIYRNPVTRLEASRWIFENVPGPINLTIESGGEDRYHPLPFTSLERIDPGQPFVTSLIPTKSGELTGIYLHRLVDYQAREGIERIRATITPGDAPDTVLAAGEAVFDLPPDAGASGEPVTISFDTPVALDAEKVYQLILSLESENTASLGISGSALANESSWDDALPYRVDGFDGYGGIYEGDLNFEMYWEDSPEKLDRFVSVLDQAEYLLISSNRQWGSVGRLPERYPISTSYYRLLLGCPETLTIPDCYNDALPGTYQGELGFDLIRVFESDPELGPIHVNDQSSEEAFTVYDHPKVFIFKKSDGFDPAMARSQLESAYLASLGSSSDAPAVPDKDLLLPEDRLAGQLEGGTWNDLFNSENLINRYPWLGAAFWYVALGLVGLVAYPLVRAVLPGLDDHGFPIARAAGLLVLSYLVWLAGSFNIPFTRTTITAVFLAIGLAGAVVAYRSRRELREEWRSSYKYILVVEGLFLGIFVVGLLIRYANPDLWHPWKGGEKPMDFSYFNAVLKSTTFPPYDPWFAGGYINYYYYGFVYVGVLVKWLGIQPSIAYNLVIPTLFAMIALGAFSMGWNLFRSVRRPQPEALDLPEAEVGTLNSMAEVPSEALSPEASPPPDPKAQDGLISDRVGPWLAGVAAMLGMAILGNLGIIAMFIRGYQKLASGGAILEEAGILTRGLWTVQGYFLALSGTPLPYAMADWYWIPSRAIPAPNDIEPITEFPMFTVLYADLHAHLIVLPIALIAIAWAVSVILAGGRWRGWLAGIGGFLFGGLAIGALRPTNTWDFYPYLALGMLAVGYALVRNFKPPGW
ncbi:MAG TPA: DUF2298 domain-containing protein, partial [Anaerolineales bacterium]|nr:DUF2298 domain-containing protein [Anaerolineales bacterium]